MKHARVAYAGAIHDATEHPTGLRVHVTYTGGVGTAQETRVIGIRVRIAAGVSVIGAELAAAVPAGRPLGSGGDRGAQLGEARGVQVVPALRRGKRQMRFEKADRKNQG